MVEKVSGDPPTRDDSPLTREEQERAQRIDFYDRWTKMLMEPEFIEMQTHELLFEVINKQVEREKARKSVPNWFVAKVVHALQKEGRKLERNALLPTARIGIGGRYFQYLSSLAKAGILTSSRRGYGLPEWDEQP